jgi:ParB-like chromosome segregation protein Spo0J
VAAVREVPVAPRRPREARQELVEQIDLDREETSEGVLDAQADLAPPLPLPVENAAPEMDTQVPSGSISPVKRGVSSPSPAS